MTAVKPDLPSMDICCDTLPAYDARVLTTGGDQARIVLDGQVYTLRITRAWCEGGKERDIIAKDFRYVMGASAPALVEDFDALMTTVLHNARRPVMRHGLGCKCFGGDESAFANMIAAAAGQDRDDAMLFASTIMTGHAAWSAVSLAQRLGQVFLRLAHLPVTSPEPTHGTDGTFYRH